MPSTIYEEFLELATIDGKERALLLPDWVETTKRLGLTEEDVRFAVKEWIPNYCDIQYLGCRKMIGGFTRETIDHAKLPEYKAQGKKLIYGILPALTTSYTAIKKAGGDDVFVSFPDLEGLAFLQTFFGGKGRRYFELAEQHGMTYGARHCALNKIRIGMRLDNFIPSPTVSWSWGLVCDEGTKTDEYINCLYDEEWRTVVTRLPHDTCLNEVSYEMPEKVRYLGQQFRHSMIEIEEITGIKVKDEDVADAYEESQRFLMKQARVVNLVAMADPQPLRASTLVVLSFPFSIPFNTGVEHFEDALDTITVELQRDINKGIGIFPKGAPKVGFYFNPWALPWIDKIFLENGVATGISLPFLPTKAQMAPPQYTDPYEMAAEQWLKMLFSMGCKPEIDAWVEKINMLKPDGMIVGFLDYDRWIGQLHQTMSRKVEELTGVPTFYMEGDFYDGRDYSPEALRSRIESICQILKQKKVSNLK